MADQRISELPQIESPNGVKDTDLMELSQFINMSTYESKSISIERLRNTMGVPPHSLEDHLDSDVELRSELDILTNGSSSNADSTHTHSLLNLQEQLLNSQLPDQIIETRNYKNESITREKLAPDIIGSDEIEPSSLDTIHYSNESVTREKLEPFSVDETKIEDGSIKFDKLYPGLTIIPIGGIIPWYGSIVSNFDAGGLGLEGTELQGWAICNGNNGTPNLKGRSIIGYDESDSDYDAVGKTGGEKYHTLTVPELPSHTHTGTAVSGGSHDHTGSALSGGSHGHSGSTSNDNINIAVSGSTNSAGSHTHTYSDKWNSSTGVLPAASSGWANVNKTLNNETRTTNSGGSHSHTFSGSGSGSHSHSVSIGSGGTHSHSLSVDVGGSHSHTVTTNNTGGDGSHENRSPYYVLVYLMKISHETILSEPSSSSL